MQQDARTQQVVMALYISSKTDPHYMVRARAAEALDILTVCRKDCYKDLYTHTDELIKELKKQGYKPGTANCQLLLGAACATCGVPVVATPAGVVQGQVGSALPVFKTIPKDKAEAGAGRRRRPCPPSSCPPTPSDNILGMRCGVGSRTSAPAAFSCPSSGSGDCSLARPPRGRIPQRGAGALVRQ